jgi:hypothetical protein
MPSLPVTPDTVLTLMLASSCRRHISESRTPGTFKTQTPPEKTQADLAEVYADSPDATYQPHVEAMSELLSQYDTNSMQISLNDHPPDRLPSVRLLELLFGLALRLGLSC